MAECLLSEIHGAEFQAILHLLSSSEHASLRQVSKAVCQRTEQHVPYITLRLCENSSIDQLQQWCQATQQFRHVSCLYIQIFGTVSAEGFDSAMLALSSRTSITQLRLSPLKASNHSSSSSNHSSSMKSCISSLMPVTRLLPKLRELVVEDVIVSDSSKDLQQLAQAATAAAAADTPWQLRSLVLNTDQAPSADRGTHTDWSDFCCTLKQLTTALADLKHFELRLPTLSYAAEDTKAAAESSNEDTQALPYDEHHYNQDYDDHFNIAAAGAGEDDEDDDDEITDNPAAADSTQQLQIQQAQVATAAAVANAVLQLGSLQELAISNLPDIWKPPSAAAAVALSKAAAATAARRPTAVEDANAFVKAILGSGVLSSSLTAAEAFATMDDCGLWLLQHHLSLRELHLSTAQRGWEMSWQQKQQHSTDFSNSSGSVSKGQHAAAPTSESFADQIEWDVYIVRHSAKRPAAAADDAAAADADADSSEQSLITTFNHSLSHYSSRLVLVTMRHITGCILKIHHDQIDDLADLMADLRSLKHLQIKIIPSDKDSQDQEEASLCAAKAIKAAAVAPGLQLLGITVDDAITAAISNNLLLPLTAAAGGPGSSLKRLKLCGKWRVTMEQEADFAASLQQLQDEFGSFTPFPNMSQADRMQRSQSADDVPAAAADSDQFWEQMYKQTQLIIDNASKSAELISPDLKWQQALKQLDGLTEFVLVDHALLYRRSKHRKFMMHTLSVGMLPASLEVLNCTGLNIVCTDDTAISSGAASSKYAAGGTASWSSSWLKGSTISLIGSDCLTPHGSQAEAECEQLQMLNLTDCQLSSPSILASSQLQQLSILRSNWPGGWAAAAAAWPNVRELVWTYNSTFSRSNLACRSSSSNAESSSSAFHQLTERETASPAVLDSGKLELPGLSVREVLPDILAQFKHLRSFSIHDLPWLSVDILKLVEPQQLRKLQYVDFNLIDSRSSLEMKQQRYLSTQIALASVDLAWARYGRPVPRRNRDGSSGSDPRVVKQWLQRQVPWACVA